MLYFDLGWFRIVRSLLFLSKLLKLCRICFCFFLWLLNSFLSWKGVRRIELIVFWSCRVEFDLKIFRFWKIIFRLVVLWFCLLSCLIKWCIYCVILKWFDLGFSVGLFFVVGWCIWDWCWERIDVIFWSFEVLVLIMKEWCLFW